MGSGADLEYARLLKTTNNLNTSQGLDGARLSQIEDEVSFNLNDFITSKPSSVDITIGGMPVQKVTGNKYFQSFVTFGNQNGLAADPRQPFQANYIIDGSTLTNTTYGSNKTGHVIDVTFKGGFSREAAWGVADPGFLFGCDVFSITGNSVGDLDGITDMFALIGEQHVYAPGSTLAHVTGVQGQADIQAASTITGGAYAVKGVASSDNPGAVINDLFSVYAQAPKITNGATVTRARSLFSDGISQFVGNVVSGSGSGSPSKGAYLGITSGGATALELSNGPGSDTFDIVNDQGGGISFNLAGILVLARITKVGDLNITKGLSFSPNTQTSSPAAGGASALPATPAGYAEVTIGGTVRKIPFY